MCGFSKRKPAVPTAGNQIRLFIFLVSATLAFVRITLGLLFHAGSTMTAAFRRQVSEKVRTLLNHANPLHFFNCNITYVTNQ